MPVNVILVVHYATKRVLLQQVETKCLLFSQNKNNMLPHPISVKAAAYCQSLFKGTMLYLYINYTCTYIYLEDAFDVFLKL